ncbi:porin family protein [bacterium]|nr:porin family protein [bacterium]
MKHLRTLAVLPLVAAAAQAYTLEFQLGQSNPGGSNADTGVGYNNTSLVGITWATSISKDQKVNIGVNLNNRSLATNEGSGLSQPATKIGVFTTSLDLSYDVNPRGGISPFIGAGIGYAWLSNKNGLTTTTSNSAMSLSGFAGVRFNISKSMDFTLTARNNHLIDVKNSDGTIKNNIESWESIAGLRFKF